jgi:predicted porin
MDQATDLAEMLEGMPEIYGNIQLAQTWGETDPDGGEKTSEHKFKDNGSTIGFKHDHAITEDLTGFLKAELEFDADEKAGNGGLNGFDEAFIGLKGDFGSIQIGSDDTVYEQMLNITDIGEAVGISGNLTTISEGDNAQYIGSFGDFTVGVTYKLDADVDARKTDDDGNLVIDGAKAQRGVQIGGAYSSDAFYVGLAYSMESDLDYGNVEGTDAFGLAAEAYIGDLTLQAQYEDEDDTGDYVGLQAIYGIKATQLALGYGIYGAEGADEDAEQLFVQALYNVSDNMYVYVEASQTSNAGNVEDTDETATAVGATYAF